MQNARRVLTGCLIAFLLLLAGSPLFFIYILPWLTYEELSAEEFNQYQLGADDFTLHKVPFFSRGFFYMHFIVDGERVDVRVTDAEYERAARILSPEEKRLIQERRFGVQESGK